MMAGRKGKNMKKDYLSDMKIALVYMIDRATQDDKKSKLVVEAMFSNPVQAEDNYKIQNPEKKRYLLSVDDLESFERFYNDIQDLNEQYGDHAIYHLDEITLNVDLENKFRTILGIWTNTEI
nr:MAG TPA: hypothetical protein [Caudoviricetes sp.]